MSNDSKLKEKAQHGTLAFGFSSYFVHKKSKPVLLRNHWHPELEILTITSGHSILHVAGTHTPVTVGDMMLFRPNQLHGMTWAHASNEEFAFQAIVFKPDLIKSYAVDDIESDVIQPILDNKFQMDQLFTQNNYEMQMLFQSIFKAASRKSPFYQVQVKALLLLLIRKILLTQAQPISEQSHSTQVNNLRAKVIADFIHKNFQKPLTIEYAASQVNVSVSTFERIFKHAFADNFSTYLMKLRVANAMDDLLNTTKPITNIALDNGFQSSSYFGSIFRKLNGVSPRAFRAAHND
ncbi:MAG: AraC family transcriptional regulator [Lactobacillus sp.]|nr:AraC family transcriptional regulator [Lactobacillus sp.]MCI2032333.1 AraC family transcriptional regulator [Lactobacillus sp.]